MKTLMRFFKRCLTRLKYKSCVLTKVLGNTFLIENSSHWYFATKSTLAVPLVLPTNINRNTESIIIIQTLLRQATLTNWYQYQTLIEFKQRTANQRRLPYMFTIKNQYNKSKQKPIWNLIPQHHLICSSTIERGNRGNQMTRAFNSHNHVCCPKTTREKNFKIFKTCRLKPRASKWQKEAIATKAFFLVVPKSSSLPKSFV